MVAPVEGTIPCVQRGGVPRVLRRWVLLRSRSEPRPTVIPMPFEGPVAEEVHGVGSTVEGAAPRTFAQCAAGSHSGATAPGMAEQ